MNLSFEEAVKLHREMWHDMFKALRYSSGRHAFKNGGSVEIWL